MCTALKCDNRYRIGGLFQQEILSVSGHRLSILVDSRDDCLDVSVAMSQPGPHLERAARSILQPLGLRQIGRSRLWVADQRFWAIVIEFQPSGFSKGSYLNVGAMWLWHSKNHWSFDCGSRIEGFTSFRNASQFAPVAEKLATRAAEEVSVLRSKFVSLSEVARRIAPDDRARGWPVYHAAVAAGLAGDVPASNQLFRRLIEEPTTSEWQVKLRSDSAALANLLHNAERFRGALLAIVQESRALHGLPLDPTCLEIA